MNPTNVDRASTRALTDLPNIGKSLAATLRCIDIEQPADLVGQDPYRLYDRLCDRTGYRHDPCVLDTFISVTRFMDGEDPKPWWAYTEERKRTLGKR